MNDEDEIFYLQIFTNHHTVIFNILHGDYI